MSLLDAYRRMEETESMNPKRTAGQAPAGAQPSPANVGQNGNDESILAGFARNSKSLKAVKLSFEVDAMKLMEPSDGKNGKQYLNLILNRDRLEKLLRGETEFCPIVYFP